MRLPSVFFQLVFHCRGIRSRLVLLGTAVVLTASSLGTAQVEAPGEPVGIPGANIPSWGGVDLVPGRFGRPVKTVPKTPAVLILHGSGGVDGRGAFYAKALQEAGIATLEITMFPPGGRPKEGLRATMPYAAAALKWLAGQPSVDGQRLGVMGFSWGGGMSLWMASETVQERLGKDVPKPVAFAPLYPVCSNIVQAMSKPSWNSALYNSQRSMRAVPMLIQLGTRDDYEKGKRPCDALIALWPAAAREWLTVRYFEGATHGFDMQTPATRFYDKLADAGHGGMVNAAPNPAAAAEARKNVVSFFIKYLKP